MTKLDFINELNQKLVGLPQKELEDRIGFYAEMIDDMIDDGLGEEEAVASIGSVDEIAEQIISEIPISKIAKERIKPKKKLSALSIVLIALGSPIWFSLLVAAFAIIISLYAVALAVLISCWAAFASFVACAPAGILSGVIFAVTSGNIHCGIALIAAGIFLAGLSIFTFFGCLSLTKIVVKLPKKIILSIKKGMTRTEGAK